MLVAVDRLVLVRHAMPAVLSEMPAERWELDEQGREASRALSAALPEPAYFVASDEPKALQTLQEMSAGRKVLPEPDFREVSRPHHWSDDYRQLAGAYVDGVSHEGWEPQRQVVTRFSAAVLHHASIAAARGQTLVIGTHGMALAVWLASVVTLEPTPAAFWAGLTFPDVVHVNLATRQLDERLS